MSPLEAQPLGQYLERLAARTSAPGGGAAAGVTLALAAACCEMAARFSGGMADADSIAEAAAKTRARALELAEEDAQAYGSVLAARRLPDEVSGSEREEAAAVAMAHAIAVPQEIADLGVGLARMASNVASFGNQNLLGDALAALLLAEAATAVATSLAEINLSD